MTATATEAAIALRGVTKEFGTGDTKVAALADINLIRRSRDHAVAAQRKAAEGAMPRAANQRR